MLRTLGDKIDQIEEAAKAGDEVANLEKDAAGNPNPFDQWDSAHIDVLASVMHGRFGSDKGDIADLLQPLPNCKPNPAQVDATPFCRCQCIQNKILRLNAEKQHLASLLGNVTSSNTELDKMFSELSSSHWGVLGAHVLEALDSLLTGDYELFAASAAAMLRINTTEYNKDGLGIYLLYKGLLDLTNMKAAYLNGVLLHDQELEAPTCRPLPQNASQPSSAGSSGKPTSASESSSVPESATWHECGQRFKIVITAKGSTPLEADQNAEKEEIRQKDRACPQNCPAIRISRSSTVTGDPPNCICHSTAEYSCGTPKGG